MGVCKITYSKRIYLANNQDYQLHELYLTCLLAFLSNKIVVEMITLPTD